MKRTVSAVWRTVFYKDEHMSKVFQKEITLSTTGYKDINDITGNVEAIVQQSGMHAGLAHIFNVGSTGAIGTIEFEPGLQEDLPALLERLIPPSRSYGHEQTWHDGNGHSHLQATLLGASISVPIRNSQLVLGTWQQIFHLECDTSPRSRRILVTLIGD